MKIQSRKYATGDRYINLDLIKHISFSEDKASIAYPDEPSAIDGTGRPIPPGRRQPDQLLQPRRAGGLQVNSGTGAPQSAPDRTVDRELVAAGVNT